MQLHSPAVSIRINSPRNSNLFQQGKLGPVLPPLFDRSLAQGIIPSKTLKPGSLKSDLGIYHGWGQPAKEIKER